MFRPPDPSASGGCSWIGIDRITTFAGFSYRPGGWHPYRETVDWLSDGSTGFAGSPLERYYERFRPTTVGEILYGPSSSQLPLSAVPAWRIAQVWTTQPPRRETGRTPRSIPDGISEHVGPIRPSYGEAKAAKLERVLSSISNHGYRPAEFPDGVVEGIFLVDDQTDGTPYRFVPTEGQHRLAVLSALGVDRVLVRQRPSGPTVRRSALHRWTRRWHLDVGDTTFEDLFDFYFVSDGSAQADRWQLR